MEFTPVEFQRRLALCAPPTRFHSVVYFGLFAPHAKDRSALSAPPQEPAELPLPELQGDATSNETELHGAWCDDWLPFVPAPLPRDRSLDWQTLHRRTHQVDATKCDRCGIVMYPVQVVSDPGKACAFIDRLALWLASQRQLGVPENDRCQ